MWCLQFEPRLDKWWFRMGMRTEIRPTWYSPNLETWPRKFDRNCGLGLDSFDVSWDLIFDGLDEKGRCSLLVLMWPGAWDLIASTHIRTRELITLQSCEAWHAVTSKISDCGQLADRLFRSHAKLGTGWPPEILITRVCDIMIWQSWEAWDWITSMITTC